VQVCLLLVAETEPLRAYADSVAAQMRSAGVRVEIKSGAPHTLKLKRDVLF
jgi:acetyl esterase/lipase